jgi:hypothetical protein
MLEFSSSKIVGKVTVVTEVSESTIENIIVNSFEGGSNYWMGLDNSTEAFKAKPKDEPLSTWSTKLLLEGGSVGIYDIEEDDKIYQLTLKKLLKGIQLNAKQRPEHTDEENWDGEDVDCILQYALFGEVVYG